MDYSTRYMSKLEGLSGGPSYSPAEHGKSAEIFQRMLSWQCRAGRMLGFFPFHIVRGSLSFKWLSAGAVMTLTNFTLTVASLTYVYLNVHKVFRPPKETPKGEKEFKPSSTESAGHWTMINVQSLSILFLLIFTLLTKDGIMSTYNSLQKVFNDIRKQSSQHAVIENCSRRVQRKSRLILGVFLLLSFGRVVVLGVMVSPMVFKGNDPQDGIIFLLAFLYWNFMMTTVPIWLTIVYTFAQVLANSFKILAREAEDNRRMAQPENIMKLGKQLYIVVEEINDKMKLPLVGLFTLMIIVLTIAVFFTAQDVAKMGMHTLMNTFVLVTNILAFHVLCSAGEDLIQQGRKFADAMALRSERSAELQTECLRMLMDPPALSPGYYCVVRRQLMSSIIAVLTSYSIVLIQFNQGDKGNVPICSNTTYTRL